MTSRAQRTLGLLGKTGSHWCHIYCLRHSGARDWEADEARGDAVGSLYPIYWPRRIGMRKSVISFEWVGQKRPLYNTGSSASAQCANALLHIRTFSVLAVLVGRPSTCHVPPAQVCNQQENTDLILLSQQHCDAIQLCTTMFISYTISDSHSSGTTGTNLNN